MTLNVTLNESLVELPPLQVTASPNGSSALTSPQPVSVLSGARLQADHTANLGETIDKIPGVSAWTTGAGIGKPVIRGLSARTMCWSSRTASAPTPSSWPMSTAPTSRPPSAERIEVIKGPASVLYGSDAVGGVVNIIPPAIPDAIGVKATVGGKMLGAYGTNNTNPDGSLLLNGASGGFGFRAALVGRNADNIETPVGTLYNTGFSTVDGSVGAGYKGTWGTVKASYTHRYETLQLMDEDPTATPVPARHRQPLQHRPRGPHRRRLARSRPTWASTATAGVNSRKRATPRRTWRRDCRTASGPATCTITTIRSAPLPARSACRATTTAGTASAPRSSSPRTGLSASACSASSRRMWAGSPSRSG